MLAVGIATNGVVFTVLDGVLFRPPPGVGSTDRLVEVWSTPRAGLGNQGLSYREFLAYRDRSEVFDEAAVYRAASVALNTGESREMVSAELASSGYFRALDLRMELGSGFASGDDRTPGAAPGVVLGYAEWQSRMGGAPDVLGRTIEVNARAYTIIGVAPERFFGAGGRDDPVALWLPAADEPLLFPEDEDLAAGDRRSFAAVARLTGDATVVQTEAVVQNAWRGMAAEIGDDADERRVEVTPYRGLGSRRVEAALGFAGVVGGLVGGLVLLIACANVSGLFLGRALQRSREIGVRLALGAARGRIVRQLLTESALVALLAGATGVMLTLGSLDVLERRLFTFPIQLVPGSATLALTLGVTALTAILAGLTPALHATGSSVFTALKDRVAGSGRRSWRLRSGFTVAQLALSLPLLTASGLLIGQLVDGTARYGFADPEAAFSLRMDLERAGLTPDETGPFLAQARDRVAAVPGVAGAAFTTAPPPGGFGSGFVRLDPSPGSAGTLGAREVLRVAAVDPEYFDVIGLPIVRGRAPDATDAPGGPVVAVVDEDVARLAWPGEDPIGQTLTMGSGDDLTPLTVVGVAGSVVEGPEPAFESLVVYAPLRQLQQPTSAVMVVRIAGGSAAALIPTVRAELTSLEPDLAINASLLADDLRGDRTELAHGALGAAVCGLIALLMACIGLYGMIATGVTERTREIGVRLALGADRARVVREFVRRGLMVTVVALGVGLPLSWAMIPIVGTSVVGVGAFAPQVALGLAAVTLMMIGVAFVSSWLPARQSSSVDPVKALRAE